MIVVLNNRDEGREVMIEVWPAGITQHWKIRFHDEADPVSSQDGYTMTVQKQIRCTSRSGKSAICRRAVSLFFITKTRSHTNITQNAKSGPASEITAPDFDFLDRKGWVCYDNHTFTW